MDDHADPEQGAAASFVEKMGLNRLLSRVKTSWRTSFGDGNPQSFYQVNMPMRAAPGTSHSAASSNPVEERTFEEIFQKRAEQFSMPSWASDTHEQVNELEVPQASEEAVEAKASEWPGEPEDLDQDKPEPPLHAILRSKVQAERLRKMTQQYNISIPDELLAYSTPPKERVRVHRPARMRVHRSCHRCNTLFGEARVCTGCSHRVCTLCESTPRQNFSRHVWDPATANLATDMEVDDFQGIQQQVLLTRANRASSQPLVRKDLRQRVRRTCHACSRMFAAGNKTCAACHHVCCVECPRFPPKRRKFPNGYPGDEPAASASSSSPAPITYTCHRCGESYPPVPHPDSLEAQDQDDAPQFLDCSNCEHTRCHLCRRASPGQAALAPTLDPDPDVVRSFEAKLAAIPS